MTFLALKMLIRKRGTVSAVLAAALLIALITSTNSIVNYINSQTDVLSNFASVGGAYLILSKNSTSIIDSEVDVKLANLVRDTAGVEYVLPQKLFAATLTTKSGNRTALIRGVEDIQAFFEMRKAYVKGSLSVNETQANVGEILANLASIDVEDEVSLTVDNRSIKVTVVGIVTTQTQSDAELIIPMKTADSLYEKEDKLSFIEFAPKDPGIENEVINHIIELLPADDKVVKVQQLKNFVQDMNSQTLSFLNLWSLAVYAVVVAASYVVANRLITEASYELAMLRTLGAKRKLTFELILTHTVTVALFGSILGLAIGVAGAQMISTAVRWIWASVEVTPFLEVEQALQILLLALASSILGCIYPAFKFTYKTYIERSL
jgi:ABC-type lipoprotein release transport system permease subunit